MSPTVATIALAVSVLVLVAVWMMATDPMYPPILGYIVGCGVAVFWAAAIVTATPPPEPPDWPELVSCQTSEEVQP